MIEDDQQEDQQQQPDLGYFSILNLNFFATDEDIKRFINLPWLTFTNGDRNHSELVCLYYENHGGDLEAKDLTFKEVGEKVATAYLVLENETKRKNYLHMMEVKYYLSQPFDLETVNAKYGGFCFFI